VTEAEILERFARTRQPFLDTFGGGIVAYDKALDRVTMEWTAGTRHCHSVEGHPRGGVVQGGLIAGWLDAAMAHACVARSAFTVTVPSLELKVSYLLPAHPGVLRSYGWIIRWGRSIAFMEAELRDEEGALLARASSTAALKHLKKAE
jgi:acyl-CoA thioesterase